MPESRTNYLGPRLRRLRRELNLTQQMMAADLAISASYVALLEGNQRPLTVELLKRLLKSYNLDFADLVGDDSGDNARRLTDALRDPIFANIDLRENEATDAASNFPGVSEALLRVYGAYQREQRALAEHRVEGGAESGADPANEARRYAASTRNYFQLIDIRAEALAGEIATNGGSVGWLKAQGTSVRFLSPNVIGNSIRYYDRHKNRLLIDNTLDEASRAYQLAVHIAYTAMRKEIADLIKSTKFSSETAANLVRRALAGYGAAALLMPYEQFVTAVDELRYDIEALSRLFGTSFEQTAHRLTTLARPALERVPFFFIRIDEAGNVSKRLDGAGFPFAAQGGCCPLWSLHSVFRTPGEIVTQFLDLPDGKRFFSIARTVTAGGGAYGSARFYRAIALVCAAKHASKLAYAADIDPVNVTGTPIGVTCSLCHRTQCIARAVPPIGREILVDDNSRAAEPFTFSGD